MMRLSVTYLRFGQNLLFLISICINLEYLLTGMFLKCEVGEDRIRNKRVEFDVQVTRGLYESFQTYIADLIDLRTKIPKKYGKAIDQHFEDVQKFIHMSIRRGKHCDGINNNADKRVEKKMSRKMSTVYNCSENFLGSLYGYPLYHVGFVRKQCHNLLKANVSLILDRPDMNKGCKNPTLLKYFKKTLAYSCKIFSSIHVVISGKYSKAIENLNFSNTFIHTYNSTADISKIMNSILAATKTEFTVLAPFVTLLNSQFDLERLLYVYKTTGVNIVGSSIKDFHTGNWEVGCYQTSMKLYRLSYKAGYSRSKQSCQQCDFIKGAFLSSTAFLQKTLFREEVGEAFLYEDYFLSLHNINESSKKCFILACPDVMLYAKQPSITSLEFKRFAKLRDLFSIQHHSSKEIYIDTCPKKRLELIKKCRVGPGLAVPPCCFQILHSGLKVISETFEKNLIPWFFIEGSVLGVVKFNDFLPWEKDADIAIRSKDFKKLETLKNVFESKNLSLVIDKEMNFDNQNGGVAHIRVFPWSVQIFGLDNLDNHEGARTKVKFGNNFDAYVPENPGKYARNRYGYEIYKHAEHWMTRKEKNGWTEYKSGHFEKCSLPNHHACLNQFKADGYLMLSYYF